MNGVYTLLTVLCTCLTWSVNSKPTAMDWIVKANTGLKNDQDGSKLIFTDIKVPTSKPSKHKEVADAAVKFQDRLWPGGVVPYTLSRSLERNEEAKRIIKEAMTEWETNTCIRFVEVTDQEDYVEFMPKMGCNADVGKRGGKQSISLGDGCLHKGVVVHEIGHIIGFWHEQNRPDRDNYVKIYTDNILEGYKEAFAIFSRYRIDSLGVDYDYHSIMHYGNKAFSKNGRPTIQPKKKGIYTLGNSELSPLDIKQANLLYKCDKINRGWTSWSHWTNCDKSCGGGDQERTRVCTSLVDGKPQCPGASVQKRVCNTQSCPEWPKFPRDFSFVSYGNLNDAKCILIYERANYQEWNHYFFCTQGKRDVQMRWSDQGTIRGMKCTRIHEPREPASHRWFDNYLCVPKEAPYNFRWSHSGVIANQSCLQWYAKNGLDGWDDNFLCIDKDGVAAEEAPNVIHGNWAAWSQWSVCTKQCGGGKRRRLRLCNDPAPRYGGRQCPGRYFEDGACNKQPCAKSDCGGKLSGDRGEFNSPNYPQNYPSDTNCTWIISTTNKKRIILYLKSFDFENVFPGHASCKFDYLVVRENGPKGKHLGTFCGNTIPKPLAATSSKLWLNMVTDKSDNRAGFRATWESIDSKPKGCGGNFRGVQGQVKSPNYPLNYPNQKTCTWKIEVPKGKVMAIRFEDMSIEHQVFCKYDYIEIRDGWDGNAPQVGRYCGTKAPKALLTTTGNKVLFKFVSDRTTSKRGFKLKWRAITPVKAVKNGNRGKENCPKNWKFFENTIDGGRCYTVKGNYFSWYGARDDCLANEADLVSVTTKSEQEFVTKQLLKGDFMWLGFTDRENEGRWAWSDNSTVPSFTNWDGGDPNDGGYLKNEDCALMKPDGKWNDYPCEDRFRYICKRKPLEPWNVGQSNNSRG